MSRSDLVAMLHKIAEDSLTKVAHATGKKPLNSPEANAEARTLFDDMLTRRGLAPLTDEEFQYHLDLLKRLCGGDA